MSKFPREILSEKENSKVCSSLQSCLVDLIDFSLKAKQAHWCVVGSLFRPVHIQLDEIIEDTRDASDEVAERIAALGVAPDGRTDTVRKKSRLGDVPADFTAVAKTVSIMADALKTVIDGLRGSIDELGELDPISEDLLIGVSAKLEKHLWMLQAQEV